MQYPIRLKENLQFQIKQFVKKFFQKWDTATNKPVRSDIWEKGFSPRYLFELVDEQQLELSKEQLGQMLVGAFEEKKTLKEVKFFTKTNGKTGKDVRYFLNVAKDL